MLNMKVAIFLAGFGMALAIAAPAPISDRKKRDVPHSVIQPTDDPFGNTAPSDAFPINFPISKAPIPVNPFDFNPPSTAQPSDILSSNIPISKTPLPINPFDNNLPPSGVFPSTPNITATIDVPGKENGSSTAVVVACDGPNFTGTCVRVIAPLGQCVTGPAGTRADGTTSSVQIAGDVLCTFFDPPDCPPGQDFGTFRSPGIFDLQVTQYDNTISSFFCAEPGPDI